MPKSGSGSPASFCKCLLCRHTFGKNARILSPKNSSVSGWPCVLLLRPCDLLSKRIPRDSYGFSAFAHTRSSHSATCQRMQSALTSYQCSFSNLVTFSKMLSKSFRVHHVCMYIMNRNFWYSKKFKGILRKTEIRSPYFAI